MSQGTEGRPVEELTREFFRDYPDFPFCRNLAENVSSGLISYPTALELLGRKAAAAEESRTSIDEKLDSRTIEVRGQPVRMASLSLTGAMQLSDAGLKELLEFYFKHPYAHRRTRRTRLLPRWWRTFFLSVLVGHARRRDIPLDYVSYFDMLRLL